jgi:hypothetical protein
MPNQPSKKAFQKHATKTTTSNTLRRSRSGVRVQSLSSSIYAKKCTEKHGEIICLNVYFHPFSKISFTVSKLGLILLLYHLSGPKRQRHSQRLTWQGIPEIQTLKTTLILITLVTLPVQLPMQWVCLLLTAGPHLKLVIMH